MKTERNAGDWKETSIVNILIVFYSRYGNTEQMALAVAEGAREIPGAQIKLAFTGDDMTPAPVLDRDPRWQKSRERLLREYPLAEMGDLTWADAVIFGSPTRYGNMAAQLKLYFDKMSDVWLAGGLVDKIGGAFCCSGTMHGGQETTLLTMYVPMIHQGMLIAGVPYTEPLISTTDRGGSPYGPGAVVGAAADHPPNETELAIARTLGRRVARLTAQLRG